MISCRCIYICIIPVIVISLTGFIIAYGKELNHSPAPAWDRIYDEYKGSIFMIILSMVYLLAVISVFGIIFAFYKGIYSMYIDGTIAIKKME